MIVTYGRIWKHELIQDDRVAIIKFNDIKHELKDHVLKFLISKELHIAKSTINSNHIAWKKDILDYNEKLDNIFAIYYHFKK